MLLALDHYFRVREADEPAFDARVWYGEVFAGAHRFEGRTTETAVINVPTLVLLLLFFFWGGGGEGGRGAEAGKVCVLS